MKEIRTDLTAYLIRVGATAVAVILVMYLAKVWFVDKPEQPSKTATPTEDVISWQDAGKHIGEYRTVEGRIVDTYNSGKVCFLNFGPDHRSQFTAVIFASAFARFPKKPEVYYYGKKVRVSGYIKKYRGRPEIILNHPKQIKVL